MMQGDKFASEPREIMEVAMWLYAQLDFGSSLGPIPNYVVLSLDNKDGGPHHMQGRHTQDLRIGSKEACNL
jgi:hypothetical protein